MALLQVKTENGVVEGLPAWNQAVTVFRGIPYAAKPVGDLRWKAPQPAENWEGVRQCYKFGNISYQERRASEGGGDIIGNEFYCLDWPRDEDCLYLNVWTPAKTSDAKLPVGVYFHGGGYAQGYGHLNCYDGEGFAKRGCIIVTINHRLGAFGFLAHPELTAEDPHNSSGNYGLLDLVSALEWVKRNIEGFGGNPDQVTIFGQSGGGDKVKSMISTPLTRGLISGAIMQSGGGLERTRGDGKSLLQAEKLGKDILESMGYKTIAEARKASQEEILQGCKNYTQTNDFGPMGMMDVFSPCVDGYLFPKSWNQIILEGDYPDFPVMIGSTAQEFTRQVNEVPNEAKVEADADRILGEGHREEFKKAIRFGEDDEYTKDIYTHIINLTGPTHAQSVAWCENQLAQKKHPSYQYYLTIVPPGADCAHHSAEHQYVFQTLAKSSRPYTGRDFDLSNQLADYWANFIKRGNPNGENLPEWTAYTAEKSEALFIDYDLHMNKQPMTEVEQLMVIRDLEK